MVFRENGVFLATVNIGGLVRYSCCSFEKNNPHFLSFQKSEMMTSGQLKGTLLEYLVRQLLQNCGFVSVKPDGHYIYQQNGSGLFFINGKGAAHDADVLMEPPIQLPFAYPSRLLFECKAYKNTIGLDVVRNALGLRYDINEFEIVTDDSIKQRKNNKRANYEISDRKRFNYQVGVASVELFSASAVEFAANNKIPLLSLNWFLPEYVCNLFHDISKSYIENIEVNLRSNIYAYLKNKRADVINDYEGVSNFIQNDIIIGTIIREFNEKINSSYIGLIETGDLIFLFSEQEGASNFETNRTSLDGKLAKFYYNSEEPNIWTLDLENNNRLYSSFKFFLPDAIMKVWQEYSLDKKAAINIKSQYLSRIFIFTKQQNHSRLPFFVVNIDKEWIENIREN